MTTERTLMLIKPDGVENGHIGEILTRIERRRFKIEALQLIQATPEMLQAHYAELVGEPFYPSIENFMLKTPLVAMIVSGTAVIETIRTMAGVTNPKDALPGTIRGDFARAWDTLPIQNTVHSSDSVESAEREIKIWFPNEA